MRVKFLIIIFLFISSFASSKELSDFEKMLSGFPMCQFDGVYIDVITKSPQHKYFKERDLKPEIVDGFLAKFNVNESYYGLRITEIYIPASTVSVVAVIFDEKIDTVIIKLRKILVNGFNKKFIVGSTDPTMILAPEIERYEIDKNKTVMRCVNTS